ncbi:hypothetical protein N0S44_000272 [Escherichia coli]|nr:hypothetical protein [Escherichia coli]
MLSVLFSIPSLILIWIIVYECFIVDDTEKKEFNDLFMLDTPVVRIFYSVVIVSVLAWIVSFIFPMGMIINVLNLVENTIAILWLIKAWYSGNVNIWIDIIKSKFTK